METLTRNESIAITHRSQSKAFRAVANFIYKWNLTAEESAKLLHELADEVEAQAIVVELRDML